MRGGETGRREEGEGEGREERGRQRKIVREQSRTHSVPLLLVHLSGLVSMWNFLVTEVTDTSLISGTQLWLNCQSLAFWMLSCEFSGSLDACLELEDTLL